MPPHSNFGGSFEYIQPMRKYIEMLKNEGSFAQLQNDVKAFMEACGQQCFSLANFTKGFPGAGQLDQKLHKAFSQMILGKNLIHEEVVQELLHELNSVSSLFNQGRSANVSLSSLEKIGDGCIDSIWVILWLLNAMGYDGQEYWDEVRRANMDKVDKETGKCVKRNDGKILKPQGWKQPDTKGITERQVAKAEEEYNKKDNNSVAFHAAKDKFQASISEGMQDMREYVKLQSDLCMAMKDMDQDTLCRQIMKMQLIANRLFDNFQEASKAGIFNK